MATVIKCIVPDKKVVDVIRILKPFALEPPVVDPIDDSQEGGVPNTNTGITKDIFHFINTVKQNGGKTVSASQFKKICLDKGGHPTGYSYALKKLLKNKVLKRSKIPNTYEVIG